MVLSKDLKIAICFGLIMGAILSLCNLCFATEDFTFSRFSGVSIDEHGELYSSSSFVYYLELEEGYQYTLTTPENSSYRRSIGFTNEELAPGVQLEHFQILDYDEDLTFNSNIYKYVVIVTNGVLDVNRTELTGMSGFINDILYSLSIGELSSVWVLVVPILAIGVLLGLGFYLLKRLLNKIKRAKGGA